MSDPETIIEVKSLSKSFGDRDILKDLSYNVYQGETLVILGRSGTGKSVNLKTIIGLLDPSAGKVKVFDTNIHTLNESQRLAFRKQIGYVFQGAALFDSLTVLENVGFPLFEQGDIPEPIIRQQVLDRLQMVGLAHTIDQYPSELSGGMQKRVGLARALINQPQLILYDEPTSGLDPLTTDVINQIILRLRSKLGVTSIVVTHDMKSAFTIADRIIMLDQGRIVTQGTPQEIQQSENPWVQHFIAGQALDNERLDSGLMPSIRVQTDRSGTRQSSRQHTTSGRFPSTTTAERRQTSGLMPAVRNRRKETEANDSKSQSSITAKPSSDVLPLINTETLDTKPADEDEDYVEEHPETKITSTHLKPVDMPDIDIEKMDE